MLLSIGRQRYIPDTATDSVHNYYEQMVFDQILRSNDRAATDSEYLADLACVTLNRLPARYVRHDVDMTFFMTPNEMEEMRNRVVNAVNDAVDYVDSRDSQASEEEENEGKEKEE